MPGGKVVDADGNDITERVAEQVTLMSRIGAEPMTVAELAGKLAGLPPMMEIFVNADGAAMFLNDVVVERQDSETPPFARLRCSVEAAVRRAPENSKDELEALQRQRAMALSAGIARASAMHEMVE